MTERSQRTEGASDDEPAPIEVVGLGPSRRWSARQICAHYLQHPDADVLVELWDWLVAALVHGSAGEDPDSVTQRTFFVAESERTVLALQLLALRPEIAKTAKVAVDRLAEPDGGLTRSID